MDQKGWNLRNEVCHGSMKSDYFTQTVADRVLHGILLLLWVEKKKEGADAS